MQRAEEIDAEIFNQNIARAEPIMRKVAVQHGAELLPDLPQQLGLVPLCADGDGAPHPDSLCILLLRPDVPVSETAELGNVYLLADHEGNRRLAVTLRTVSNTARLARRGKTLFLLIPRVTRHKTDERVQCECDGGPVIDSMSGYVNLGFAFFVDDIPNVEIQRIIVPIVEDYIEWECKTTNV